VITLRDSNITANYANELPITNSNGLYIENTVIQASGPCRCTLEHDGQLSGAFLKNLYSESSTALNPASPAHSPFAGWGLRA